jgi:hypothetical protein
MTKRKSIQLGLTSAIASFIIGSIIFGLYYLTLYAELLFVGYGFISLAIIVNSIFFTSLISKAIKEKEKEIFGVSILMLLNVPIMLFYCSFASKLVNTVIIKFTNCSEYDLREINITGCEEKYIQQIVKGDSKTIWVTIPNDCSIQINYINNGIKKNEIVEGYLSGMMGKRSNYCIGK